MHSRITLILSHHEDHDPPPPIVALETDGDVEARVCFHEADDESSELVGCPRCIVALLRRSADEIEHRLAAVQP